MENKKVFAWSDGETISHNCMTSLPNLMRERVDANGQLYIEVGRQVWPPIYDVYDDGKRLDKIIDKYSK